MKLGFAQESPSFGYQCCGYSKAEAARYVDPSVSVVLRTIGDEIFGLNTDLESRDAERPRKLCGVITKEWSWWIMDGIVLSCSALTIALWPGSAKHLAKLV